MKFSKTEKKQLLIYVVIAYGITYLMGILMWRGYAAGKDLTAFPSAQMLYPAAGVMLAYLVTRKGEVNLPKNFFHSYLLATMVMMICAAMSIVPGLEAALGLVGGFFILGSIICGGLMLYEPYEKRLAYGLTWQKGKGSVRYILLFVFLYLLRAVISYVMEGTLDEAGMLLVNPQMWFVLLLILVQFFVSFLPFFGEEYGWRHFLQPLLQKRFGKRFGVLLVGVMWGIWHLPVNYFYYSPGSGLISQLGQQITCITLGIFFAYAYMKTENIWVPVILHYLNNNLILIVSGTFSVDALQNQSASWGDLLPALLMNGILFGTFIFAKEFRKVKNI